MKKPKIRKRNQKIGNPPAALRIKQNQNARGGFRLTDFQLRDFEATLKIPFGELRTYRWIAKRIGAPKAIRAVGSALRKNPYPFIIPCHRVVKSNGEIGQYSQGQEIKKQLIEFEKRLKNRGLRRVTKEK